jgi:Acetyl-CoA carboxylase, central region
MQEAPPHPLSRAFVRCIVAQPFAGSEGSQSASVGARSALQAVRCALQRSLVELKLLNAAGAGAIDWAQIFINNVAAVAMGAAASKEALGTALRLEAAAMLEQYAAQLRRLAIAELCMRLRCVQGPDSVQAWRIVISLPSGAQLRHAHPVADALTSCTMACRTSCRFCSSACAQRTATCSLSMCSVDLQGMSTGSAPFVFCARCLSYTLALLCCALSTHLHNMVPPALRQPAQLLGRMERQCLSALRPCSRCSSGVCAPGAMQQRTAMTSLQCLRMQFALRGRAMAQQRPQRQVAAQHT